MRNSALVASATLALLLVPVPSMAQEGPHWILEVPVDLQTLNQNINHVKVLCATEDHAPSPGTPALEFGSVGIAESEDIPLNAQGSFKGVTMVSVTARRKEPGAATHYVCWLGLDWNEPGPDRDPIQLQPRSGTQLVSRVTGALP